jgi:hypothetical protein
VFILSLRVELQTLSLDRTQLDRSVVIQALRQGRFESLYYRDSETQGLGSKDIFRAVY